MSRWAIPSFGPFVFIVFKLDLFGFVLDELGIFCLQILFPTASGILLTRSETLLTSSEILLTPSATDLFVKKSRKPLTVS